MMTRLASFLAALLLASGALAAGGGGSKPSSRGDVDANAGRYIQYEPMWLPNKGASDPFRFMPVIVRLHPKPELFKQVCFRAPWVLDEMLLRFYEAPITMQDLREPTKLETVSDQVMQIAQTITGQGSLEKVTVSLAPMDVDEDSKRVSLICR